MIRFPDIDSLLGYRQFCWHNIDSDVDSSLVSLVVYWRLPIATINQDAHFGHKLTAIIPL